MQVDPNAQFTEGGPLTRVDESARIDRLENLLVEMLRVIEGIQANVGRQIELNQRILERLMRQ